MNEDLNELIRKAQYFLNSGQIEQAIGSLQKAVKSDPKFINAWLLLGNIYFAMKQHVLVQNRTDKFYNREVFFRYENVSITEKNAYDTTLELGWDTYKDGNPSEPVVRDAFWLHSNFFLNWSFDYEERLAEVNQTKIYYYDRIEENLNKAIEGCIAAMNSIEIYEESETMGDDKAIGIDLGLFLIFNIIIGSLMFIFLNIKIRGKICKRCDGNYLLLLFYRLLFYIYCKGNQFF